VFDTYYDLPDKNEDYSVFWEYIQSNNKNYNKYVSDGSKLAYETELKFKSIVNYLDLESLSIVKEKNKQLAGIFCGSNYTKFIKGIVLDDDKALGARAYPDGTIFITKGLDDLLDVRKNINGKRGVIAHEIAHIVLRHAEIYSYALSKKEKSNNTKNVIAQVLTGVAVGGAMIAHANSGATFTEKNGEQYTAILNNSLYAIEKGYERNTYMHRFSYSREQEIESDIIACLFLYWIGENPNKYMEALSLLKLNRADYTDESSHPSINFRINTLMDYFNNAYIYVNKKGETQVVPKWRVKRYKEKYPGSKKAKKGTLEKVYSTEKMFLSKGKYYSIPLDKVNAFRAKRIDASVVNVIN
jgi:predicted Zn-dependent protease